MQIARWLTATGFVSFRYPAVAIFHRNSNHNSCHNNNHCRCLYSYHSCQAQCRAGKLHELYFAVAMYCRRPHMSHFSGLLLSGWEKDSSAGELWHWTFNNADSEVIGGGMPERAGALFTQCKICNIWQYIQCMGIRNEDAVKADHYFCETCRSNLHIELIKYARHTQTSLLPTDD